MIVIGEAIRKHRKAKKLSIEKLAHMVGTSKGYLWEIECTDRNPSFYLVYCIAEKLKISLDELTDYGLYGLRVEKSVAIELIESEVGKTKECNQ